MKPARELRIDLGDLKAQIVKRIGVERSKRYFYNLNMLLSQKLSKSEFNKLCFRLLGRENLPLHNQLIHAILKNACHAKTPPTAHKPGPPQLSAVGGKSSFPNEDGHELSSGSGVPPQVQALPTWSNGVVFPMSPRKCRSALRDRKLRDRPVPLGPNGKVDFSSHQSMTMEASPIKMSLENEELTPRDYQRPLQHLRGLAEKPENERGVSIQLSTERQRTSKSFDLPPSLHRKDQMGTAVVEDKDQVEQENHLNFSRSLLIAPLGIPRCSASIGGAQRPVPTASNRNYANYFDSGGLCETETLKKHMEQIVEAQGLGGVSMDCANLLNNTLDVYLKKLIKSCVELVESNSLHEPRSHQISGKQSIQAKPINGLWPTNHNCMQSSGGPAGSGQEQRIGHTISFLDFKVAMELNPQQLGEDWPLLLEKICMHGFKE